MYRWILFSFTIFCAFILALLPLPDWTIWLRPAWVLLILIYWAIALPSNVNIFLAWFVGLIMDLLNGTIFGEHALAYILIIHFVSKMQIRLKMVPLVQQTLSILFLLLIYQICIFLIQTIIGSPPVSVLYWLSSLTSMLIWPWVFLFMNRFLRGQKILH